MLLEVNQYTVNGPGTAFASKFINTDYIKEIDRRFYSIGPNNAFEYVQITFHNETTIAIAEKYASLKERILGMTMNPIKEEECIMSRIW